MDEQLRKRLEKAADKYAYGRRNCISAGNGFIAGAEYGYKEAIKQAKEWLKENAHDYSFSNEGCDALLIDFERNMNKLWEE